MDITGENIVILGGAGLVGNALCRRLMEYHNPKKLVVTALTEPEVEASFAELKSYKDRAKTNLEGRWGNIFVRSEFKDIHRNELLQKGASHDRFIADTLDPLNKEIYEASYLREIFSKDRPTVVIDCINTATALAYQDIFDKSRRILERVSSKDYLGKSDEFQLDVENLIAAQYTPQLIRHVQILWKALVEFQVKSYIKVGTTGTGGLGLNIPYTHSEEKPSRVLLAKSAVAGAHSMLLFLLGRTAIEHQQEICSTYPDRNIKQYAPIIKEVKPAAAIGWKKIDIGPIMRKGKPIEMYDMDPNAALDAQNALSIEGPWKKSNGVLEAPYVDTGENGIFSRGEFEAITDEGQMEFITPEEIAESIEREILGASSGSDVVTAMDSAVLGPTYRAGILRQRAIDALRKLEIKSGIPSIAFENLGPPRLSKLLFEIYLISRHQKILQEPSLSNEELSQKCFETVCAESKLRQTIISIGVPIITPEGKVIRGSQSVIPSRWDRPKGKEISKDELERYAHQGWVDLRSDNIKVWNDRLARIRHEASRKEYGHSGSIYVRNETFWETIEKNESVGSLASWIFLREEDGERIKR